MVRVIHLIPARGGSKGLPRKNLALLGGLPLIVWSIRTALEYGRGDIFVTSDDADILAISAANGATPICRPSAYAQDSTNMDEVIKHVLDALDPDPSTIISLLQPTSPLRGVDCIKAGVSLMEKKSTGCAVGCVLPQSHPAKALKLNSDGSMVGLVSYESPFMNRQSLPICYSPNGAIYVFTCKGFNENSTIPREPLWPIIMTDESSIDIDSSSDLNRAAVYLEKRCQNHTLN